MIFLLCATKLSTIVAAKKRRLALSNEHRSAHIVNIKYPSANASRFQYSAEFTLLTVKRREWRPDLS